MELRLHHIIDHLYNIFLENDGSENCAQLLEEEVNKMLGTKYFNDEHDCNVVSVNSLNIQNAIDVCTSHDKNVGGWRGRVESDFPGSHQQTSDSRGRIEGH